MPGVRGAMSAATNLLGASSVRQVSSRALAFALFTLVSGWLSVALAQAPAAGEPTLPRAEWQAIKAIISDQLAALQAGDGGKAFTYASPGIRQQFGNAGNFLEMVRAAYGALIVARYSEFLEGAIIEGRVIQPLRLIGPDNTVRVALYTMEKQADGSWKIGGCVLAPSTVQAA